VGEILQARSDVLGRVKECTFADGIFLPVSSELTPTVMGTEMALTEKRKHSRLIRRISGHKKDEVTRE
jgi:hypothetical protein